MSLFGVVSTILRSLMSSADGKWLVDEANSGLKILHVC
jgi:hypothetical protein